ncbi:helix-turn-helix transcriptional regulator [Photobacterium sp. DNB23_23_1]|uniref:Helix-turn-helix transcriptional regulator n=1 Tax=Photobacterium pectinilyticum TaxID=2906793 RepID=A0ABT1N2N1_9GAMM|nr:helix-turn-helix transcriptional regulator [Photobacterium sp. ZSDE20]MCQ1058802.1 helix-turn-helix transcriptional regulator [Photobacterium sp. ZSDE20]MDD1823779.1 helix-turn-helix transcriptional regulator [Photobacterium sp. ZSDE20]
MEQEKSWIAQRIKDAREWRGISQVAMAKHLDVARQTYLDLESGKTEPRISTLVRIAELTDQPLGWFVFDIQRPEMQHEQLKSELLQLTALYEQLAEPLRSKLLIGHINQLKVMVEYLGVNGGREIKAAQ